MILNYVQGCTVDISSGWLARILKSVQLGRRNKQNHTLFASSANSDSKQTNTLPEKLKFLGTKQQTYQKTCKYLNESLKRVVQALYVIETTLGCAWCLFRLPYNNFFHFEAFDLTGAYSRKVLSSQVLFSLRNILCKLCKGLIS